MARSLPRKIAIAALAAAGGVVVLLALLLVLIDAGVVTKRATDLVLPRASKALGRDVTVKGASLKLFPNPRVKLDGLTVAGRPGEPSLVEAESLDVEVGLWPLLRSLGKDVEVRAIALVRPNVNLVRAKDGSWNFEGLGSAEPGAAKAPSAEPAAGEEKGSAHVAVRSARVEKGAIRVIDRTLGKDDPGVALSDLDLDASGVGPGLPFDLRVAAALADEKQNLNARLSVARLPDGVPRAPEDWPEMQGTVALGALALDRLRSLLPGDVGAIVRGGTVTLDARLSTIEPRGYKVDGSGDLKDVRLRGQPASGRFRAAAAWSPARPSAAKIDLTDIAVRGPGVDLGGHASVEMSPMRAWFVLTGPLLDLDAVMGILPEAPEQAKPAAPKGELLPEATRREIQAAGASGTIAIGELRGGRLKATDVKARATLSRGTLTLDQMDGAVFGGRVSAAGTKVSLSEKEPTWKLAAKLSGIDLGQATSAFAGQSPLLGKVDGTLAIDGRGTEWEKLKREISGLAALAIKDGALTTTDLGDDVLGALSKGLEVAGKGGVAKKLSGVEGGKTTIRDLSGKFTVKDGFLAAQSPLKFGSGAGDVTLGGRIGLDGRLDLSGGVAVPKKLLAQAISGVPLPEKLEVPLGIGGTLSAPRVQVRADQVASSLARGQVEQAKKAAQQEAEKAAKEGVESVLKRLGRKP